MTEAIKERVGALLATDEIHKSRLSRAIGPYQPQYLTSMNRQRDRVHSAHCTIGLGDLATVQDRVRH